MRIVFAGAGGHGKVCDTAGNRKSRRADGDAGASGRSGGRGCKDRQGRGHHGQGGN